MVKHIDTRDTGICVPNDRRRPRILVMCPHYLPGFRTGGPVRSIATLIDRLGDDFEFLVITHCHDYSQKDAYEGIPIGQWVALDKATVLYLPDREMKPFALRKHLIRAKPDAIYLNSAFHPRATLGVLLLRRLGLAPRVPVVLAPRGEFSPGALRFRAFKKRLFLSFAKATALYAGLRWQASSEYERKDVLTNFFAPDRTVVVHIAPDTTKIHDIIAQLPHETSKVSGELRVAFLGRVSRIKNIEFALDRLKHIRGKVEFNIYGPFEDKAYERICRSIASALPPNIMVHFHGPIPHDKAICALANSGVLLFPSQSENFGHVILESLAAGCPVIISDRTPWRDLEQSGVGWDIPLDRPDTFEAVLQQLVQMDAAEWRTISESAKAYAEQVSSSSEAIEAGRRLFSDLIEDHGH